MKENFFATCPKGLESLVADELRSLGADEIKETVAGVKFQSTVTLAYKICLWSRFASRILLPIASFRVSNAEELYKGTSRLNWQEHMTIATTFLVNFSGKTEAIKHTQFAAQKIKDAIVDQFRKKTGQRPMVEKNQPMLRINALLKKGIVTLSIDFSGESLHRRGYRLGGGEAPLKENLAAAILYRAKWPEIAQQGGCLVDPMCGSGTLLIEALLMAGDIAPGLKRQQFGFQGWKKYQPKIWQQLLSEANERAKQGKQKLLSSILGFDANEEAIQHALTNIQIAGLSPYIKVQVMDIKHLSRRNIQKTYGLCICNPPYGERLEDEKNLLPLYRMFSNKLKENFLNWEAAILTGNSSVARNMGLRAHKKYAFFNGTIPCELLLFHIKPDWFVNINQRPPINSQRSTDPNI